MQESVADNAAAVFLFSSDHVLEKNASRFHEMPLTRSRFGFDSFEDEVGGVNLAMRMWIRNADGLAFVFKNQHVLDLGPCAELPVLVLPNFKQVFDRVRLELCKRLSPLILVLRHYHADKLHHPVVLVEHALGPAQPDPFGAILAGEGRARHSVGVCPYLDPLHFRRPLQ